MLEDIPEFENPKNKGKKTVIFMVIITAIIILLLASLILLIYIIIYLKNKTISSEPNKEENNQQKNKAPIIGIASIRNAPDNETQYTADLKQSAYIEAIEKSGGIPLTLPSLHRFNSEIIQRQIETIDALLIQGGLDVTPSIYNEEPKPELGFTDLELDNYSIEAIKQAAKRKIPILGICRGMQIINVCFGGTLYQDLKYAGLDSDSHRQDFNACEYKHTINVEKNSLLSKLFPNNETLYVNSFHHQAVKDLAKNFVVEAKSSDDIIEAIRLNDENQWIFGVQFHPEKILRCKNDFLPIFTEYIEQAKKFRNK